LGLRRRNTSRKRRQNDRQMQKECRTQGSPSSRRTDSDLGDGYFK
jgi:hypothetical protein